MTPTSKLNELRKLMAEHNLAAYYIPSEDAHQVIMKFYIHVTSPYYFPCFVCFRANTFLKGTEEGHS